MGFDLATFIISLHAQLPLLAYSVLASIVFAESGLFFGFFLPGDSLLVTAGLLATQGYFDISVLLVLLSTCAILGDSVGYWMGGRFGRRFFPKKHLARAEKFYKKHGGKAIVLARFVPIVRTFAPIAAGVAGMEYKRFLSFNIFGGIGWVSAMLLIGYTLGRTIPTIESYLLPVIAVIVFLSLLPGIIEVFKHNKVKKPLH